LWRHIGVSLLRFAGGYGLALLAALPLGLLLGWWSRGLTALDPLIQVIRPISPIAWFPLAVLWFGVGNAPAVFIITLSAFFPILLATISGVRAVPSGYLRIAANLGAPRLLVARSVVLPAAFPTIVVGLRIALGTAWIHLVAGEMLGAQSGLGFLIVDARNFLRTDLIIAGMLVIGILGLALDRLVGLAEWRLRLAWGTA
jgi:NitT/TauT family transport system permease protein